jgi:cytochrome c-type biogenesis protein CcmE
MKIAPGTLRIGAAASIIVGVIVWLAYSGVAANQSYYKNISELHDMGDKAYKSSLKLHGFVKPGSIERYGPNVTFVMNEFESHTPKAASGQLMTVVYKGTEPPPDTFKDDSEAIADGSYGRDGVFHANALQAKCASKYAPATPLHPGEAKPGTTPPAAKSSLSSTEPGAAQPGVPAS